MRAITQDLCNWGGWGLFGRCDRGDREAARRCKRFCRISAARMG